MGIAVAAVVASTAIAAGSAIHQGEVRSNYAHYQEQQAKADAFAKSQAAKVEAKRIRGQAKQQKAKAIAALAGNGVDVNSATALDINKTIGTNAENDAFMTITNGNNGAARLNSQAQGYAMQASAAKSAGYMNAASDLLSSVGPVAKGWKTSMATGSA